MNHLEKTISDMQDSCLSFLDDNASVWEDNTVIKEDVEALKKNKLERDETAKTQKISDPSGQIAQKKNDLTALAKKFYKATRKLCHMAKKSNNQALLTVVDIPQTGFLRGEEKDVLLKYDTVLAALSDNLASLTIYKFIKTDLDSLEAEYNKLIAMPGTISVLLGNQKSATRSIKELNDEARTILDLLDDAMEGMIDDDKLLDSWFDARKIKGRHVYKKADQAKTVDTKTTSK